MITVDKILSKLSKLGIELIAGENHRQNEIGYITILELPEKTDRFKKKGLTLSTFQSFKDTEQMNKHIAWLKNVGIVGIGFHVAHYKEVPEEVVQHANKIELPLFRIPEDVPYYKILDIFNQCENDNLNLKTHEIYKINDRIMEAIAADKEYGYIINLMGNYIKQNLILLNNYLRVSAVWKNPTHSQEEMDYITNSITSIYKEKLLQTRFFKRETEITMPLANNKNMNLTIIPMQSKDKFLGYLIVDSKIMNDFYNKEVVKIGLRAMSLQSSPAQNSRDYNKIKDIQKFISLINNTVKNISKDDFYVSIENFHWCIRTKFASEAHLKAANNSFNELLLEKNSNSLSWIFENTLIAFIEDDIDFSKFKEVLTLYPDKSVGISHCFPNASLSDIKVMNQQALTALKYSTRQKKEVSNWDELGIDRVAENIADTALFHNLDQELLGDLIEYDARKNGQLMVTLECCLKHFFNFKAVGEELFIHPNTVKYRLEQIKKYMKTDIHDYLNYALLITAFSIYHQKNN
jgi:purine catabolism regulator